MSEITKLPPKRANQQIEQVDNSLLASLFNRLYSLSEYFFPEIPTFDPNRYTLLNLSAEKDIFLQYINHEFTPRFCFTERKIEKLSYTDSLKAPLHLLYSLTLMEDQIVKWKAKHYIQDITLPGTVQTLYQTLFSKFPKLLSTHYPSPKITNFPILPFPALTNSSGTDCFMNAALQLIFSNPELSHHIVYGEGQYPQVMQALFNYQFKIWKKDQTPLNLATKIRALYPVFQDAKQHDTAEAIMKLIEPLDSNNFLFYSMVHTIHYVEKSSQNTQQQAILTLEVIDTKEHRTLEEHLFESLNEIMIEPSATIEIRFKSPPEFLIINFKRTGIDATSGEPFKINSFVGLQKYFYLSGNLTSNGKGAKYELQSFNTHVGRTPTAGHYVHYRDTVEGYHYFSDEEIKKIDELDFLIAAQNCYVCVLKRIDTSMSEEALTKGELDNSHKLKAIIFKIIAMGALQGIEVDTTKSNIQLQTFIEAVIYDKKPLQKYFNALSPVLQKMVLDLWATSDQIDKISKSLLQTDIENLSIHEIPGQKEYDPQGYLLTLMVDRLVKDIEKYPENANNYIEILSTISKVSTKKYEWLKIVETIFEESLQFFISGAISYYKKDSKPLQNQAVSSAVRLITKCFDPNENNALVQSISQFALPIVQVGTSKIQQNKQDYTPLISPVIKTVLSWVKTTSTFSEMFEGLTSSLLKNSYTPLIGGSLNVISKSMAPKIQGKTDPTKPRSGFDRWRSRIGYALLNNPLLHHIAVEKTANYLDLPPITQKKPQEPQKEDKGVEDQTIDPSTEVLPKGETPLKEEKPKENPEATKSSASEGLGVELSPEFQPSEEVKKNQEVVPNKKPQQRPVPSIEPQTISFSLSMKTHKKEYYIYLKNNQGEEKQIGKFSNEASAKFFQNNYEDYIERLNNQNQQVAQTKTHYYEQGMDPSFIERLQFFNPTFVEISACGSKSNVYQGDQKVLSTKSREEAVKGATGIMENHALENDQKLHDYKTEMADKIFKTLTISEPIKVKETKRIITEQQQNRQSREDALQKQKMLREDLSVAETKQTTKAKRQRRELRYESDHAGIQAEALQEKIEDNNFTLQIAQGNTTREEANNAKKEFKNTKQSMSLVKDNLEDRIETFQKTKKDKDHKKAKKTTEAYNQANRNLTETTNRYYQLQGIDYKIDSPSEVTAPTKATKFEKTKAWVSNNVSGSGEVNVVTISGPNLSQPTLTHIVVEPQKPKPTTYAEGRHQIQLEKEKGSTNQPRPSSTWQDVQAMQQHQINKTLNATSTPNTTHSPSNPPQDPSSTISIRPPKEKPHKIHIQPKLDHNPSSTFQTYGLTLLPSSILRPKFHHTPDTAGIISSTFIKLKDHFSKYNTELKTNPVQAEIEKYAGIINGLGRFSKETTKFIIQHSPSNILVDQMGKITKILSSKLGKKLGPEFQNGIATTQLDSIDAFANYFGKGYIAMIQTFNPKFNPNSAAFKTWDTIGSDILPLLIPAGGSAHSTTITTGSSTKLLNETLQKLNQTDSIIAAKLEKTINHLIRPLGSSTPIPTEGIVLRKVPQQLEQKIIVNRSALSSRTERPAAQQVSKSVNLPAWKKMTIDMDHIASGHKSGGWRVPGSKKTLFPEGFSEPQLERIIREAYKNGKKIKTQENRITVIGKYEGIKIKMHINIKTKVIESAYPAK